VLREGEPLPLALMSWSLVHGLAALLVDQKLKEASQEQFWSHVRKVGSTIGWWGESAQKHRGKQYEKHGLVQRAFELG
jgi:hypothetical protein